MPYSACLEEWQKITGSSSPYYLKQEQKRYEAQMRKGIIDLSCLMSEEIVQKMSDTFQVSYTATRIQLKQLLLFID